MEIDIDFLFGEITATPREGYAPLGVQFADGPNFDLIVEQSDTTQVPNLIIENSDLATHKIIER